MLKSEAWMSYSNLTGRISSVT